MGCAGLSLGQEEYLHLVKNSGGFMWSKPGTVRLLAAACLLVALPGNAVNAVNAVNAQNAPIMPLASQSLLLEIATAGSRPVAVGERGHILYSDDGGLNWHQALVPTTQMLTCVYFIDDQRGRAPISPRGWSMTATPCCLTSTQ